MQVNPNNNIGPIYSNRTAQPSPQGPVQGGDQATFTGSQALNEGLSLAPDSRPEAVERAKALISDSNYPPPETIAKISQLLAIGLAERAE